MPRSIAEMVNTKEKPMKDIKKCKDLYLTFLIQGILSNQDLLLNINTEIQKYIIARKIDNK